MPQEENIIQSIINELLKPGQKLSCTDVIKKLHPNISDSDLFEVLIEVRSALVLFKDDDYYKCIEEENIGEEIECDEIKNYLSEFD